MGVLVRRRYAWLVEVRVGMRREGNREEHYAEGVLSDGRVVRESVWLEYGEGEREAMMERMLRTGDGSEIEREYLRRSRVYEWLRGQVQRKYGCVPLEGEG